jgi:hypothetical protein
MNSPQRVRYLNSISPCFVATLTALLVSCVAANAQTALTANQIEKVDWYVQNGLQHNAFLERPWPSINPTYIKVQSRMPIFLA